MSRADRITNEHHSWGFSHTCLESYCRGCKAPLTSSDDAQVAFVRHVAQVTAEAIATDIEALVPTRRRFAGSTYDGLQQAARIAREADQ